MNEFQGIPAVDPKNAEYLFLLGAIAHENGSYPSAIIMFENAIAVNPNEPRYHSNLGNTLKASGDLVGAMASYHRAVELCPDFAEGYYNLGVCLLELGEMADCIACFQRSVSLDPQFAASHSNLGVAYQAQGKLAEAVHAYQQALALKPDYVRAHHNLGNTYIEQGRVEDAIDSYSQALAARPDFAESRYSKGLAQLLQQNFVDGWTNYEARWQTQFHTRRPELGQPAWLGEKLPAGRLLVWSEQGIGDMLLFAGLMPDVIRAGNSCVLQCTPRLKSLFARSFADVEIVSGFEADGISAQIPIGSLPSLFRLSAGDFQPTTSPYLIADKDQRDEFRLRYKVRHRLIGVSWHTNDCRTGPRRSIGLPALAQLFAMAGNSWVSLQYGDLIDLRKQIDAANAPLILDESVDALMDLDRFAAQVASMDLVITIDNSTAHLAGSLGIPVWLLLPFAPDWRWFLNRNDSPWYPSMHIFRQPAPGDWATVLEQVCSALT